MKTEQKKLNDFIFKIVADGWTEWEPDADGYEKTAIRYVGLIQDFAKKNLKTVTIDYKELKQYFIRFFDACSAKNHDELRWVLFPTLTSSGAIKFQNGPTDQVSNKKIRSSYKRIKSVLYSLVHSFFSMMNTVDKLAVDMNVKDIVYHMDDFIFDVMKKKDIIEMKIFFSKRKVFPDGEYSREICKSIDYYMKWLPNLAESQNVDSVKIKNITVIVTKEAKEHKIAVTAMDDRGIRHTMQLK